MDLARDEETRVRNLGRLALEKAAKAGASKAGSNGISRTFATVSRVNGDGTIDVSMGDYTDVNGVTSECILRGLRMTVACSGARVGDRVIVDTYAHVSVVTGILANADNAHYVNRTERLLWHGNTGVGTIVIDSAWSNYLIFAARISNWSSSMLGVLCAELGTIRFSGGYDQGTYHEYYLASLNHVSGNTFNVIGLNSHKPGLDAVSITLSDIWGII